MAPPRIWIDEAERKRAYRAANPGIDKRKRPEHDNRKRCQIGRKQAPFITIDGEAIGESGYHLLAASTGDSIENRTEGLSSADCIRFLLALKEKHGKAVYCGFALGYDCEHWIRDFGAACWEQLRKWGKAHVTIDGVGYRIEYLPRKWFKISRSDWGPNAHLVKIYDVFSFFQAGFISVVGSPATGQAKGWGAATADEMAVLKEWKGKRGEFAAEDWEAICDYNQIECRVLVRLMEKLREALLSADINISSWHGPGAVANFLLKRYNMKEHIGTPPAAAQDAISRAYFGGRFQVFKFGHLEGVYDYDISSAYPYATTLLPSAQGEWQQVSTYQGDDAPWTVYLVSWSVIAGPGELSPFPWRSDRGIIHYPSSGRGWYWGWEVAAARRGWGDAIRVEDGWRLYPVEEGVFGWMNDLAEKRVSCKQLAKRSVGVEREKWQGIERAYKLALNSVYGKTIQTVGQHRPFLCPMWAGLITAHTRSKLLTAALADPSHLVCFATDGLFSTAPNAAIECGSQLGDWELAAEGIRLELYQSGCYAIFKNGECLDNRFRGVSRTDVPWDTLRREWKRHSFGGNVKVQTKRFIGHRTALAHNKPEQQCTWITLEKDIKLMPGNGTPQGSGEIVAWQSMFPGMNYEGVSTRYRKLPAGDTEAALAEEEVQP